MKILNELKKLFQRESSSQGIIPIHQIIPLPTREVFINNQIMLDLIDTYKKEYKNILSQLKYFTSLDINSKELSENMSTNIELLLNIFMTSDEIKQYTLKDKINYLINVRKLDLYGIAISKLETEVTARLIALNKISHERKTFISRDKKNALANEINNLSIAFLLFQNKKFAIELEKNHYLTSAIYKFEKIENPIEEERFIMKKRTMLLHIGQVLFPENKFEIREDKEHVLMDIAEVERMIELYVYHHKEEVETLKRQLERISEQNTVYEDKEKVLSLLQVLEYKYLAFYEYGREYIAIEDLMQLYLIKFNIHVLSENGICETLVDENTTDIELDCYKGIVEREIEFFVKGQSELNNPEAIEVIMNILKNGNAALDVEQILKDKYLFNVLLSMGSKKDLINFIKNFKVSKKDYGNIDFCDEVFEFEEELPLETIYRLMLVQNMKADARLYELFEKDIYPEQEYYYLPVGLKGIHCIPNGLLVMSTLYQSTFNTIQKMRKLMHGKYVVCPSSFTYIKGGTDFFKDISIKSLLFYEGLEIATRDTMDIQILEREKNKITYRNNRTGEITISDSQCHIDKKWGDFSAAGLITYVPNKNLFIEEYNSVYTSVFNSSLQQGKNIIEARRNSKTKLLSRAYVDVSTRYGDFCLHIEEKKTRDQYGSHILLSLYHGHHEEIMNKRTNDFNWPEYGIFRTKYMKENDFYQWMLGFVDSVWSHPFRNVWSYGQTILDGRTVVNAPIYSFSEYQGHGKRGTIFIDGKLKLCENKACIPDMFKNLEVDDYEIISYNSKAYFGTSAEHVAILKYKNSAFIRIIYKQRNHSSGYFEEVAKTGIHSPTNSEFTEHDFEMIIVALEKMPINESLKKFVIDEIKTYVYIHYKNISFYYAGNFPTGNCMKLSDVLKHEDFVTLLETLKRSNTTEFVEKLIESIIQIFHISIGDLLGKPKSKEIEEQEELKITKKLILNKKDEEK